MRFENNSDLDRELKAIKTFTQSFNGSYLKLGSNDIDFKVYKSNGDLISYVEIKGRKKNIQNAFPLPVAVRKLVKLSDKKLNPVIIWSCYDGIIYSLVKNLKGNINYGGRKPRQGSFNDMEMMAYFKDNVNFKKINFNNKLKDYEN